MPTLKINGVPREVDTDADTPLLWVLRDDLGLTGTRFGCGAALCGTCTVQIDGRAARSCVVPVGDLAGKEITTIEGATDRIATAVKAAWLELDVAQCGYCQSGQVMAATALLRANPRPSPQDVERAMDGNLCRCGAYPRIRAAVLRAAQLLTG